MVFLEDNLLAPASSRWQHWFAASGASRVAYPFILIDGGYRYTDGPYADYEATYRALIDEALVRPPQAEIAAQGSRVGGAVHASVQVTNRSGRALSYESNRARVYLILYEEAHVATTGRIVRDVTSVALSPALAPNATTHIELTSSALSGVNWAKMHGVAFVEYRPGEDAGPYDILQAAMVALDMPAYQLYMPLVRD